MQAKYTCYDLETLSNFFSAYFKDFDTGKEKYFIIHEDQNDLDELIKFLSLLKRHNYSLVGYNCIAFDAQVLEHIIARYKMYQGYPADAIARDIYAKAQQLINLPDDISRFQHLVPEWQLTIPHIDVYKQKHYDGMQKRCSLKWLEFTMRFDNIETMPIHHSNEVLWDQFDEIIRYNANDVRATTEFFKRIMFETELRTQLSKDYELNLLNASEPRMAREIFGKFLCEEMGITYRELKNMQTHRRNIRVKDILFPYLKFENETLSLAKKSFENLVVDAMNLKGAFEFSINYHGIQSDMGLGGLHGCIKEGIYESTNTWDILDLDVVSFYPRLGIENDVKPAHLGKSFPKVYNSVFEKRQQTPKKDPRNYVYKIILNSTYGLSNEINSYLYDPLYTLTITINGQLTLLMLCEMLVKKVPSLVFYQQNTDGVTIGFDKKYRPLIEEARKEWEAATKLQLEDASYKKMIIRDVNNYIAIKKDFDWKEYQKHLSEGKSPKEFSSVKHKGIFETELDFHKNPSMLVIPKALEAYFLGGVDYTEFVKNHEDIFDFCAGVKIKKDFNLVQHSYNGEKVGIDKEIINQTVLRYYVSTRFTSLKKKYKPDSKIGMKRKGEALVEIEKGWNTTYYNIHSPKPIKDYDINHKYYISEIRSIINVIEPNQNQTTLF